LPAGASQSQAGTEPDGDPSPKREEQSTSSAGMGTALDLESKPSCRKRAQKTSQKDPEDLNDDPASPKGFSKVIL
jgi:hypothetical protein